MNTPTLTAIQSQSLLQTLKNRFIKYESRHSGLDWDLLRVKLEASPEKLWSLQQMESTGGEPDVVGFDSGRGEFLFFDCSAESPKERRSLCYDREALQARKANKPTNSVIDLSTQMGIALLSEEQYLHLQSLGEFDLKTSSWLYTPAETRKRGGAIFGDRRYGRVFVYHNGADSYYAARGFRGALSV
ncbi:uncharacterized protein DUF4256 [Dyadobacter jejuensis]|uniref:Uncharacterized protein DUF4256 n=1 Tax=Dyadobacter jejuensis TaxID=1082580 RepID=A0A316AT06_9BACT|nr:DUF4256 domain-containing protein [Dyadobacter jejuensis]PWJ60476.1 uncharacterized protein DUF4256 [Dyadobacter jejuensis]